MTDDVREEFHKALNSKTPGRRTTLTEDITRNMERIAQAKNAPAAATRRAKKTLRKVKQES